MNNTRTLIDTKQFFLIKLIFALMLTMYIILFTGCGIIQSVKDATEVVEISANVINLNCENEELKETERDEKNFVSETGDNVLDTEINMTLDKGEKYDVDFSDWIDDSKECYRVGIRRDKEIEDEYLHLKDYFFVRKDGKIKKLKVEYPSKKDSFDSDRYVFGMCDFEAKYEDVTFDGNKDIVIFLGQQGAAGTKYYCAYIYNDGEFRYNKFFETIPNPRIDKESQCIEGSFKYQNYKYKYISGEFVKIFDSRDDLRTFQYVDDKDLNILMNDIVKIEDGLDLESSGWMDEKQKCYRISVKKSNKEKDGYVYYKDYFFVSKNDLKFLDIEYPIDSTEAEEYPCDEVIIDRKYVDLNADGEKDILISVNEKDKHVKNEYKYIYNESGFVKE